MKYQAFAWNYYPNGAVKGEAHVFESREAAEEWLKTQKDKVNHLAVELSKAPNMWELVQGI